MEKNNEKTATATCTYSYKCYAIFSYSAIYMDLYACLCDQCFVSLCCAHSCMTQTHVFPLYSLHHCCRWYHSDLTGREAEDLLKSKGQDGSFLVRSSVHHPGFYVLSARVKEKVTHIVIRNQDGNFDIDGGPKFSSSNELIEYYKKNPMVETSGG